jgi:hypothetical protein
LGIGGNGSRGRLVDRTGSRETVLQLDDGVLQFNELDC